MSVLDDFLNKKYGRPTRSIENPIPGADNIGAVPEMVLRRNPNRIGFNIINLSGNIVYGAFDAQVTALRGILLDPNGGNMNSWIEEDGELTQREVWLVAPAGASAVFAIEMEVM